MNKEAILRFRYLGIVTIIFVYLVIAAGSTVRASGAGMGCPDWPTCFGRLIPPTEESQLPVNYKALFPKCCVYSDKFNAVKTWTEFANRLVGVALGILILLTAWGSRIYRETDKTVFYLAVSSFFLVGFQGWMGAQVVASELEPVKITLHMILALVLLVLLIYTITRSQREALSQIMIGALPEKFKTVLLVALGMTLIQIAMGTQVRQAVDLMANSSTLDRAFWRDSFPIIFYVHRSFSSIILFTNLWLAWKMYQSAETSSTHLLKWLGVALASVVVIGILAGISLDRLGMPVVAQPVHLLMANLIFGLQFFMYLILSYAIVMPKVEA